LNKALGAPSALVAQCRHITLPVQPAVHLAKLSNPRRFALPNFPTRRFPKKASQTATLSGAVKRLSLGVLALQGDFEAHARVLRSLETDVRLVRAPSDLEGLDGLVIPGGESTVMSRLGERYGLIEPLRAKIQGDFPVFGTCAGLIFLAQRLEGASQTFAQSTLGVLDCTIARNAYGAQNESFQSEVDIPLLNGFVPATFIRAPRIVEVGDAVEVLGEWNGEAVVVRQNAIMACAFHPEIEGETRLHRLWIEDIQSRESAQ